MRLFELNRKKGTIFLGALIALTTIATRTPAQDPIGEFFRVVGGKWSGTLEYKDYSSGERVVLPTRLRIVPSADGASAEFLFTYDDFGRVIRSRESRRIDAENRKYFDGDAVFDVEHGAVPGTFVVTGKGQDGDTIERIRETFTFDNKILTILKETRDPWQFRNVLRLTREPDPIPEKFIPAEKARADLFILQKTLKAIHPGVYRYITPARLDSEFAKAASAIVGPVRESELFVIVAQLVAKLRCGHTYLNPYNQDEGLRSRLFGVRNYLPFYFAVIDGRFIVTAIASSRRLPIGSEIVAINGVRVNTIIAKLLTVTTADGNSTSEYRVNSIATPREAAEHYALFDLYFPLFFPVKDELFEIEAVDFKTKRRTRFTVFAMTKPERTAEMAVRYGPTPSYDDGWRFEIRPDGIGYLRISNSITWRLKRVKFVEFLAAAFAELREKSVSELIIDIRGNGGGDSDIGFELSRYLASRKLGRYADSLRFVRNVLPQKELAPFLDTYSDELKKSLTDGMAPASFRARRDGLFEITDGFRYDEVAPYPNKFRGRTVVIQDSSNASASFQFLEFVRDNRLATLIGQTSGGNRQGINGGNYFFLHLPETRFEIDVPVYFQAPRTARKDEPIVPDILVRPDPRDIGDGFDRPLAAAIQHFRKTRAK